MTEHPDEHGLIRQCVECRDEGAWETFVERYAKLIWSSVQKTFSTYFFRFSQEDIEDVYNSVFLSLVENDFRKLRQYRSENSCSLPTYLAVVTVRMTIDYLRRDKRHVFAEPAEGDADILAMIPDDGPSVLSMLEEQQRRKAFSDALAALPADDRMLCLLLCRRDCPPEAAAKLLGVSVDVVYTRKNRIIGKLKKNLSALQENPARSV